MSKFVLEGAGLWLNSLIFDTSNKNTNHTSVTKSSFMALNLVVNHNYVSDRVALKHIYT